MPRLRLTVALLLLLAACQTVTERAAVQSRIASPPSAAPVPQEAGQRWAATEENVALALPRNLTYCPLPKDRNGVDRGQTFLLTPPITCDPKVETARGFDVPSIHVYAVSNILALEELGGIDEADSAIDLARAACGAPDTFVDVLIFQRPAAGCRSEHADTIDVTLFGISNEPAPSATRPPSRATITLHLHTTRSRLAADWLVLQAIGAGAYVCDPVAPSRGRIVRCPQDGPW